MLRIFNQGSPSPLQAIGDVGGRQQGRLMGYRKYRVLTAKISQGIADLGFAAGIECGGRFVQYQARAIMIRWR